MNQSCHNCNENIIFVKQIITIFFREYSKNYAYSGESHNFWELVYIDKGEMIATAGDTDHRLTQGQMIFHKPKEYHNLRANGHTAANVVIISFKTSSQAMDQLEEKIVDIPEHIRKILASFMKEAKYAYKNFGAVFHSKNKEANGVFGSEQLVYQYLELLLIQVCRLFLPDEIYKKAQDADKEDGFGYITDADDCHYQWIVHSIKAYLKLNLDKNLKFETICKEFYISGTQLKTVFRKATNKGVMSYFRELKLEEAKKLIREDQHSFTEIGSLLGFETVHYFSTSFKNYTGMSPSAYKKSILFLEGQE